MKRKILAGIAALLLATGLAGCSAATDNSAGDPSDQLYERSITLSDGRDVTCIIFEGFYKGGVSCDWEGTR